MEKKCTFGNATEFLSVFHQIPMKGHFKWFQGVMNKMNNEK